MGAVVHFNKYYSTVVLTSGVGVAVESEAVIAGVVISNVLRGGIAAVELTPEVYCLLCTIAHFETAETIEGNGGIGVTHHWVGSTMDVHHIDVGNRGDRLHFCSYGSANGCNGLETVAVLNSHSM